MRVKRGGKVMKGWMEGFDRDRGGGRKFFRLGDFVF